MLFRSIDGAQSTGKTTLFNHLRQQFADLATFIPEASRTVAERFGVHTMGDWPRLLADAQQLQRFFEAEESWQKTAESQSSTFIADSSLHLIQAYRQYFGAAARSDATKPRYDLILYCPATTGGVGDNFRFLQGRADIDRICRGILSRDHDGQLLELPVNLSRLSQAEHLVGDLLRLRGKDSRR